MSVACHAPQVAPAAPSVWLPPDAAARQRLLGFRKQRMRFGKPSILHQKHGQGCGLPPSGPIYVTLAARPAYIHQDPAPPSRTHPNAMSYTSLILVVLAAMAHAAWNLLAKRAAMVGPMFVFAYGLAATILYAPWVIWVLAHDGMVWSWPVVLCILASSMLHLGYSLCLQRGYQVADLSVVYPIARGTGPLLSTMGAFTLLSEPATSTGIAGMLCVVGGVLLIATQGRLGMFRQAQAWIGVRWGVVIGLFIAAYTVVDAYGVKMLLIMPVLFDWFTCATRTLMMTPHVLRRRAQYWPAMRGYWHLAIAVGVLSPLGYILVLYALRNGAPLSLVAPAREMSMMLGTLAGMFLLREKVGIGRLAGCLAILAGVVLLGSS
ncbi:EamA-like transporter family protein [Bordetella bronchiseptica CARE970018BB]|nr:EamA-like transporter family protein [Bordetella bronchiseptica CARE970018BB]KDC92138.1 EamA-like transporter family protein [Bordetella bronchiseptica MBORD670]KDD29639.1 EamA-like transporter family protein [Bordetella bronchiseptica MBORD785]KDD34737.1 EamA-like transporter family protein [Bordetella bronchiseptica MBORD849]